MTRLPVWPSSGNLGRNFAWILGLLLLFRAAGAGAETLSLADCLDLARQDNPTLQVAAREPHLAGQQLEEARSTYRPRLDLDAGYTLQQAPQQFVIGGRTESSQDQNYAHMSVSAEQTLYDFGRSAGRVGAARAAARAAEAGYAGREQDVFLQTVTAYYRVLDIEYLRQAAADEVTQRQAHLRVARVLYDEGVVTRNDVLQAEVQLASSRQLVLAREGALKNAWLELNYLTGRPDDARADLQEDPVLELDDIGEKAVWNRPEIEAQRQQVAAAKKQVTLSRGGYWPQLFARLGADYVENSHVKEQTIYSATLGLRVNLYAGGATTARLRQATERLGQARRRLDDLQRQSRVEYRAGRNDAEVAARRIDVAETAIRQAEENLRINRNRYKEQVGTATEVVDAQTLLTRTRTEYYRAKFDYQVAVARVRRAAGLL